MRRSPRLQETTINNAASRTGNSTTRTGPALQQPHPQTPQHLRTGAALDALVNSFEEQWNLGLPKDRSQIRSPAPRVKTAVDRTYDKIKLLFYSKRPALNNVIQDFARAAPGFPSSAHLNLLDGMLKSQTLTPQPPSRTSTPRNEPPKSLLTPQTTKPNTFLHRRSDQESTYVTADEPGSSTDEDDNAFETPPSPTPSSRRKQASASLVSSNPRKRPSDSSNDDATSPKLTRTTQGKQTVEYNQPSAKSDQKSNRLYESMMPPPRSFHSATIKAYMSHTTSANTSFNASVSSSQQTTADTVNTSFTSYDGANERDSKMTRTSSTTMGSLDEQDIRHIASRLESEVETLTFGSSQDGTRGSTSTCGSIDELELMETTANLENVATTPLPSTDYMLSSPTTVQRNSPLQASTAAAPSPAHSKLAPGAPQLLDGTTSNAPPPPAKKQSPVRIPYYIRNLPTDNLFVKCLPAELHCIPYYLLFMSCRISEGSGMSLTDILRGLDPTLAQHNANSFWSKIQQDPRIVKPFLPEPRSVWTAARKSFEGLSFKGKLVFNSKVVASTVPTTVFKLELLPLQVETSCQLQRQFGSDRFLYLTVPPFRSKKPGCLDSDHMPDFETYFDSWLGKEHSFLGRSWRIFHLQQIKRKGDARKDDTADMRLILFAVKGAGIEPIPIGQMLNEFVPFEDNRNQSYCKALARLDLGLSKTTPTLTFKPSQIRRIPDIFSDSTADATEFNDPKLHWDGPPDRQVMNDGCARMSVGAAKEIWKLYREISRSEDPLPSAMQGRIGGAKGMWIISGEPQSRMADDLDIWIEITKSQLKFEPPWEDREDDRPYNKHRLTFNLLKYSCGTSRTDLHISFIPILADRGVPKSVIAKIMTDRLHNERKELLNMLCDPSTLYDWVTKESAATDDDGKVRWQAALPLSLSEKIKHLLCSGLQPLHSPYLAFALDKHLRNYQMWMEQKLRAPLGKATFMYGVTDSLGFLHPGEVHINFSTPFTDRYTGDSYRNLNDIEILLARQPACRRSDIQKVRVRCLPELSHLVDVVVFPTSGPYPLAGKLQGGDYDGDIFWTCWEDCLVEPFRNAPAPMAPLDPSKYGIKTDSRKLHEVMDTTDLSTIDHVLREVFKFKTAPSMLGKATNFLDKVIYEQNKISSPKSDALCDVHDLLVDAPKQAYSFTEADFEHLVRYVLKCGNPGNPAYKEAMKAKTKAKDNETGKIDQPNFKYRPENVLDHLYFGVFRAHNIETMKQVNAMMPKEEDDDEDLRYPYLRLRSAASSQVATELDHLISGFAAVRDKWNGHFVGKPAMTMEQYTKALETCYAQFTALMPSTLNRWKADIAPLLTQYLGPSHGVTWEAIRASAFYTTYPKKYSLVWHMAGKELAELKARGLPGTRHVVAPIFANLKPKPRKKIKPQDEDDDYGDVGDEDFESAVERHAG